MKMWNIVINKSDGTSETYMAYDMYMIHQALVMNMNKEGEAIELLYIFLDNTVSINAKEVYVGTCNENT